MQVAWARHLDFPVVGGGGLVCIGVLECSNTPIWVGGKDSWTVAPCAIYLMIVNVGKKAEEVCL